MIFHVRLQGNVPKANIDTKDLGPALNKHLHKVYLRLIWKKLGTATNVTTLKYFLPMEELRILNTHHANILLNPPQSSTPDDVCCFLLVYGSLVSFFSKYFLKLLVYHSQLLNIIGLYFCSVSMRNLLKTHTRVRKLRFLHFDYKVFSISEDFPNVN